MVTINTKSSKAMWMNYKKTKKHQNATTILEILSEIKNIKY